jgi:DNA-binding response OmpR family regulator
VLQDRSGGDRVLATWEPTHVLLDLMLPDATGVELLRHARSVSLSARFAFVSAAGRESYTLGEAMRFPDAVFHKPVTFAEVEAWIVATAREGGASADE